MIPTHLSYSQITAYEKCPRSWYLSKVAKAEQKQAWYILIGRAFHSMIEDYLDNDCVPKPDSSSAEIYFFPLVAEARRLQPDTGQWLRGGSFDDPIVELRALQVLKDCFERAVDALEGVTIWEVEYDCTGMLPGCEVPIKGFGDIVGEHSKYGPFIGDWKTGMSKPKDNFQLETYKALLRVNHQARFTSKEMDAMKGFFLLPRPDARKDVWGKPILLDQVNPGQIGARYQKAFEGMKKRVYQANKSGACKACFYQESCVEYAGLTPQAIYYDKAEEDGYPF